MFNRFVTSHVGSFPLEYSEKNIERIVSDLAGLGIDIPPYPQLRDFIEICIQPLLEASLISKEGKYHKSRIEVLLNSRLPTITISEVEYARKYLLRHNFILWRAPVTGVFTIASKIYIDDPAKSLWATALTSKEVVFSFFKEYVTSIVKYVYSLGYRFIVLDEPMLANIVGSRRILFNYKAEEIIELYDRIFNSIPKDAITGIHICGRISPKLHEILCQIPSLKVLNHEFKDAPENVNIIRRELLEKYDKILSPGIVSSRKPIVESIEETRSLLNLIIEKFDNRVNIISADCGFAALRDSTGNLERAYKLAIEKLGMVVHVVQELNKKQHP